MSPGKMTRTMRKQSDGATLLRHECLVCGKTYSTNSHLRRHEATHSGHRSVSCPSCGKAFSRQDVARRHMLNCGEESSPRNIAVPITRRGKKPRACDRCFQSKVSCSLGSPCVRCFSAGLQCSYVRLDPSAQGQSSAHTSTNSQSSGESNDQSNSQSPQPAAGTPWMLGFTNPAAFGSSEALSREISQDNHPSKDPLTSAMALPLGRGEYDSFVGPSGLWFADCPLYFESMLDPRFDDDYADLESTITNTTSTILDDRAQDLISQLSDVHHLMKLRGVTDDTDFDTKLAQSVFTPRNIEYFAWVFFDRVQPYHPILHPATFDIGKSSLPLVVAIFCMGSMFCAPNDHAVSARSFFNIIEEFIFGHRAMRQLLFRTSQHVVTTTEEIEILQAALTILTVQIGINNELTRRRVRVERHPAMNAAIRLSGVLQAKHRKPIETYTAAEWGQFVECELAIRLAHWTHMLNCFMAGCFNIHPNLAISEMLGDMPCREEIFEAKSAAEFERLALREANTPALQPLARMMQQLFQDSCPSPHDNIYKRITPPALFTMITSLSIIIGIARACYIGPNIASTMLRACKRWKALWDFVIARDGPECVERPGFAKNCLESMRITETYIQLVQSGDHSSKFLSEMAVDSTKNLNEFINKYHPCQR